MIWQIVFLDAIARTPTMRNLLRFGVIQDLTQLFLHTPFSRQDSPVHFEKLEKRDTNVMQHNQ